MVTAAYQPPEAGQRDDQPTGGEHGTEDSRPARRGTVPELRIHGDDAGHREHDAYDPADDYRHSRHQQVAAAAAPYLLLH
ncbi:hypothetical protein GCM10029963_27190 [Micromonospora andamanensis]